MSRSFGGTRLTTRPPIATSPWVISSSPAIIRSSVDLPQPDGPTSTQNSPSAIAMSTPRITCVEPNHFWTPVIVTAAMLPPCPYEIAGGASGLARRLVQRCSRVALRLARPAADDVLGPARGEPRDDVLRRLAPQLLFGLDRIEGGVRREDDLRMAQQRAVARHGLFRQDIQRGARQGAGVECAREIGNVHDRAALD